MKTIADILEHGGNMTEGELAKLVAVFPNARVVVKWESSPRSVGTAKDIQAAIQNNEKNKYDYAREVFFSAESFDALCAVLGVKKKYLITFLLYCPQC